MEISDLVNSAVGGLAFAASVVAYDSYYLYRGGRDIARALDYLYLYKAEKEMVDYRNYLRRGRQVEIPGDMNPEDMSPQFKSAVFQEIMKNLMEGYTHLSHGWSNRKARSTLVDVAARFPEASLETLDKDLIPALKEAGTTYLTLFGELIEDLKVEWDLRFKWGFYSKRQRDEWGF